MKCPECGETNPDGVPQCRKCGEDLTTFLGETVEDLRGTEGSKTARSPMEVPTQQVESAKLEAAKTSPAPPEVATERKKPSSEEQSPLTVPFRGEPPSRGPRPPSTTEAIPVRSVLGNRYEILELIGEGGMGRVYKARDLELDRLIALKTIRSEKGRDPQVVQRFKKELLLARKVTHKNVVRIHDLGEAQGIRFFTMEYVEGQSLKQIIRQRGALPVDQVLTMAKQILGALEEAHSQGVIHRDLKPQNIMVDQSGSPQIMDFGIARSAEETEDITATGLVIGTPDYMSPEQARGEKAGAQSDLFSFGVILFEMLTGDVPYKADSPISKVMMRLTQKPPAPHDINPETPRYLESVVLKCMEVDPSLRYKTAKDVLFDLEREHVDRSLTLRVRRALARRVSLAAAATLVLVAAVALYFTGRLRTPPPPPTVSGDSATTLAILPFTNATGSDELEWMRTGLPEMMMTDLAQSRYVRPVAGERVLKVMRELGIAEHTRFDESALDLISERAPAQSVLYGQYIEASGTLRLDLTLRKAGSGVPTPLHVEAPATALFALVDEISDRVKGQLDLTAEQLKGDSDRPISEVSTTSLAALRAYYAGLTELRNGANQAAVTLLKEAVSQDAGFAMAHAKLAEAYLNANEILEARAAVDRADNLADTTPLPLVERYLIHATAARVREDYEMAAESYRDLANLYPQDPDILLSLGRSLEEMGKFPEALESYHRVAQMAPDYSEAHLSIAWVLIFSGRPADAIQSLEEAMSLGRLGNDPETQGMVHSILGLAYRETNDFDKSMEHYQLCLDFREKAGDRRGQAIALARMAPIHVERGETQKALAALQQAVAISREIGDRVSESDFLLDTGFVHSESGDLDRALSSFRQSLQIEMEREDHSRLANRLNTIAELYQLKGQYDDAIVYLEQAKSHLAQTEDQRDKAINLRNIGLVRKAQGLYPQAVEAFLEARAIFEESEQRIPEGLIQHELAEIYVTEGRYADAFTALQKSLEISQEYGVGHDVGMVKTSLGRLLTKLGMPDEAEELLSEPEQSSEDPEHVHAEHQEGSSPENLLGRAEVAHLAGNLDDAAEAYWKANYEANLSGRKEVAVESRVALGRLYLVQGKLPNAERLLSRTRLEAAEARLRPLEARAALALANVCLARDDAEAARKLALEAAGIAENFSGRPILYEAHFTLGGACEKLGRAQEAVDAYANAASILGWIRGSLLPEHVDPFMGREDIQAFLRKAAVALEKGGRLDEATALRKWIRASSSRTESPSSRQGGSGG